MKGLLAKGIIAILTLAVSVVFFCVGVFHGGFQGDFPRGAYYLALSISLRTVAYSQAKSAGLET